MNTRILIDRFDSTEHLTGKQRTYKNVKEAALRAGRFSCFEASSTAKNAQMFTELVRDPDVELVDMPYPWQGVKRREKPQSAGAVATPSDEGKADPSRKKEQS